MWRNQYPGHRAQHHCSPPLRNSSPAHALEQIINAQNTDAVLKLVVDNFETLNGVIQRVLIACNFGRG